MHHSSLFVWVLSESWRHSHASLLISLVIDRGGGEAKLFSYEQPTFWSPQTSPVNPWLNVKHVHMTMGVPSNGKVSTRTHGCSLLIHIVTIYTRWVFILIQLFFFSIQLEAGHFALKKFTWWRLEPPEKSWLILTIQRNLCLFLIYP